MTPAEALEQIRKDRRSLATTVQLCWQAYPNNEDNEKIDLDALARLVALAKRGALT